MFNDNILFVTYTHSKCVATAVDMVLVITDLPLEVVVHILSFLPIEDLLQAQLACQVFYNAGHITYSHHHCQQLGLLSVYLHMRTYVLLCCVAFAYL